MDELQQAFIGHLADEEHYATVFLVSGVKLNGKIDFNDEHSFTLSRDGLTQLVFKSAVATILPSESIDIYWLMEDGSGA